MLARMILLPKLSLREQETKVIEHMFKVDMKVRSYECQFPISITMKFQQIMGRAK